MTSHNLSEVFKANSPLKIDLLNLLAVERTKDIYLSFLQENSEVKFNFESRVDMSFKCLIDHDRYEPAILLDEIKQNIHDSEDYSDVNSDIAQCSLLCFYYAINFLLTKKEQDFKYVHQKIAEIVDILEQEDASYKSFAAKEFDWQVRLIQKLSEMDNFSEEAIFSIREENNYHRLPIVSMP